MERLLEENNSLLRELLVTLGKNPRTPQTLTERQKVTPRGAESVFRSTRESIVARERDEAMKLAAPWRNGPDTEPTPSTSGDAPPK